MPVVLGARGKVGGWLKIGCQECRVQVTLDRTNPAGTLMPALREGFLGMRLTAVTVLRQLGGARGKLVQGAASVCSWVRTQRALAPYGAHVSASSTPNPACNSSLPRCSPYS